MILGVLYILISWNQVDKPHLSGINGIWKTNDLILTITSFNIYLNRTSGLDVGSHKKPLFPPRQAKILNK